MEFNENVLKCTKKWGKVIFGDFCGFRADRTPPEAMISLWISMVRGAFGRPGARRGAFSIFLREIKILHDFHKFPEASWKFKKIHENHGISWNSQLFFSRSKTPINPIGLLMVLECPWPPNPEIPPENMKIKKNMGNPQKSIKWAWICKILGKYGKTVPRARGASQNH